MRMAAAVLGIAAAGFLGMPSGATAASSDGAQRMEDHTCQYEDNIGYLCRDVWLVANTTITPSGNVLVTGVGKGGFTVTDPALGVETQSQESTFIFHGLDRPEGAVSIQLIRVTFTIGTASCDYRFMIHYAQGQLIFDEASVKCQSATG